MSVTIKETDGRTHVALNDGKPRAVLPGDANIADSILETGKERDFKLVCAPGENGEIIPLAVEDVTPRIEETFES